MNLLFLSFMMLHSSVRCFQSTFSRIPMRLHKTQISMSSSLTSLVKSSKETQYVFVGGKGGVGKTSTSAALSLGLADSGLRTLVVSTDPAHSLGDALDVNLSSGKIVKIPTESKLWALEIDVDEALDKFKQNAKNFDAQGLAKTFGVPPDILESLGLDDLASIFTNPPPGIDEIVALLQIFQLSNEMIDNGELLYQRIVIDTAPTGHTIRLLQLPLFLNSVTGKLIKFRSKITNAVDSFKSLFGGSNSATDSLKSNNPLDELEKIQSNLSKMQSTLRNPNLTQFIIVSIPTQLAYEESKRLLSSLQTEKIAVSHIICNQILNDELSQKYLQTRSYNQRNVINRLSNLALTIQRNIEITEVPYVDTEVMGLYGLKFFSSLAHPLRAKTASNPIDSRKITIFGGKGGVGKTTSSASWAVHLCEAGFKTLVVSTDPAHSLGDALQEKLTGIPKQLDTSFFSTESGGQLWAMEIDPADALDEFKSIVQSSMPEVSADSTAGSFLGSMGLPDIKADLGDILGGINDPPPGTDEVVALTKLINYLKNGYTTPNGQIIKFDRIVLDTAPTGHTLRMLKLPPFLLSLVKKLKSIRDKTGGMSSLFGGGSNTNPQSKYDDYDFIDGSNNKKDSTNATNEGQGRLDKFEVNMIELETMLHNPKESEFTIVTIPTELATAESSRLLQALSKEKIAVRRVIINQVIPTQSSDSSSTVDSTNTNPSAADTYLNRLRSGQKKTLNDLRILTNNNQLSLIEVPYFDMEVRTVYGLRVISNYLLPKEVNA